MPWFFFFFGREPHLMQPHLFMFYMKFDGKKSEYIRFGEKKQRNCICYTFSWNVKLNWCIESENHVPMNTKLTDTIHSLTWDRFDNVEFFCENVDSSLAELKNQYSADKMVNWLHSTWGEIHVLYICTTNALNLFLNVWINVFLSFLDQCALETRDIYYFNDAFLLCISGAFRIFRKSTTENHFCWGTLTKKYKALWRKKCFSKEIRRKKKRIEKKKRENSKK